MEEQKEKMNNEETLHEKINKEVENKINSIIKQGIKPENIENLYKLVDIHKDIANEQYWLKEGGQDMRYRYGNDRQYSEYGNYGEYREGYGARGRGRERDSQGRFKGGRGSGRYRGHETLDDMYEMYGEYQEGREEYGRGNYGAKSATIKSLEYMMESVVEFIEMLNEEASSPEEMEIIKKYTRKISEM